MVLLLLCLWYCTKNNLKSGVMAKVVCSVFTVWMQKIKGDLSPLVFSTEVGMGGNGLEDKKFIGTREPNVSTGVPNSQFEESMTHFNDLCTRIE